MTNADAVGWIAAGMSAVWGLPQCLRILRVRTIDGVSPWAWQATLWSGSSWAGYGALTHRSQVIWCNVVMTAATVGILILITRLSGRRAAGLWLPPVAGTCVTIAACYAWGDGAFTVTMAIPMLGAQSLHLYGALTATRTRGLSVTAFTLGSSAQALWAVYGWLTDSLPIVVLNVIGTTLMAGTILVTRHRDSRMDCAQIEGEDAART